MSDKTDTMSIHDLVANTIRGLAMDAVQKAESGHPGLPMGMADVATVLWSKFLKFNPADPHWPDRDRFVLSAGHGSMLLYSLLHLSGFNVSLEDIKQFRQWGSITPGHPENELTPGVETTTGPLGQGLSNSVGMALAERWMAEHFNEPGHEIVDHYTYVIASDGDLMEGISHEACALAGHLGLGKLIVFYDNNHITIDGPTELAYSDDVPARFQAYHWHTQQIDGHDPAAIEAAIIEAKRQNGRPSLIACRTHIGFGSPHKQDTSAAHGEPLGVDEIKLTKENLGWPLEPAFYVPDRATAHLRKAGEAGAEAESSWQGRFFAYQEAYPDRAAEFSRQLARRLPENWLEGLPVFEAGKSLATRASSGQILTALSKNIPELVGGSADLTGSNKTLPKGETSLEREDFSGRYIHYGIREHGMGGMMNGMSLHGGLRPYGGTFLVFSDYMKPSIRLAALMEQPVIYVFTHDSIGLGEDGPTHQPVEQLIGLRAIPNLVVFRPAEAGETAVGWQVALQRKDGPTALVLTRQGLPTFDPNKLASTDGAFHGAYVLKDADRLRAILMASGSEVHIALDAQALLAAEGIGARVVSMPSWELFEAQDEEYRESVLPSTITARVSIEAAATHGWDRYTGLNGMNIGLNRFGASAPYKEVYEHLGITAEAMVSAVKSLL
ncbi:MAG: transketolase [Candidatus Promineifilaceae bacterium]